MSPPPRSHERERERARSRASPRRGSRSSASSSAGGLSSASVGGGAAASAESVLHPQLLGKSLYAIPAGVILDEEFPYVCAAGILGSATADGQGSSLCAGETLRSSAAANIYMPPSHHSPACHPALLAHSVLSSRMDVFWPMRECAEALCYGSVFPVDAPVRGSVDLRELCYGSVFPVDAPVRGRVDLRDTGR